MMTNTAELTPLTEETIERLRAVAGDPVDAMRLAADVYATNAYLAERAIAEAAGQPRPKPPEPISRYLQTFTRNLRDRLTAVSTMLTTEEQERLKAFGVVIERQLEADDGDLLENLILLTSMDPAYAALWVRTYLAELEARVAS